ncbi:hypothetical protein D3C80_517310 [compost metagenome]
MDQALQAMQKQGRRGSLAPSCQFHRARTMDSSRRLSLKIAQFCPASHQYKYDGAHGFPLHHARHLKPCGQIHDLWLWQPIHRVKFYQPLEAQLSTG